MGYYKLGIIPAAGKATRFGGTLKELLPLPTGMSFIQEAYFRLEPHCDKIVVVSNEEKIKEHVSNLKGSVLYAIQKGDQDIMSAILTAIEIPSVYYLFTMPDTYLDRYTFQSYMGSSFGMGLFETYKPERFGCLIDGVIVNKQPSAIVPLSGWGVLAWDNSVSRYWINHRISNYTDAINAAIAEFGAEIWRIENYQDCASVIDYRELWL